MSKRNLDATLDDGIAGQVMATARYRVDNIATLGETVMPGMLEFNNMTLGNETSRAAEIYGWKLINYCVGETLLATSRFLILFTHRSGIWDLLFGNAVLLEHFH